MKFSSFLCLVSCFLFFIGCKKSTTPITTTQISLTAEYVGVTEAEFRLQVDSSQPYDACQLLRDGQMVSTFPLSGNDTTLLDTTLLPAHTYAYQAVLFYNKRRSSASDELTITTMDTTSHEFQWDIFTFGNPFGSGVLYDVAITNENDIWAVGEIYADSTQPWLRYNAVHWDGQKWELKRIPFIGSCSAVEYPPIRALWAFSENQILFTNGGAIAVYDGTNTQLDCRMNSLLDGAIAKIFAINPSNVYLVGGKGTIIHYNGSSWQRVESRTDVDLLDIWGSLDGDVWVCGWKDSKPTVLIRIENQRVEKVFESRDNLFSYDPCFLTGAFYSVWSDEFNRLYVLTWYDLYRCVDINCRQVKSLWGQNYLEWASYSIRGSSINNIVTVGQYGRIWHFNGVSWRFFEELVQPTDRLRSVSVKNDLVVSVGYRYLNAIERFGLIYLGRK